MEHNVKTLLFACTCRDEHVQAAKALLPGVEIIRRPYMDAKPEDVEKADIIYGNVAPEYLKAAENLKWMQLASAGTDGFLTAVPENVPLTNATGAYGENIAEYMLGALLFIQRRFGEYYDNMKVRAWPRFGQVDQIAGSTVLVLGLGDIGGCFAKNVKALGAYVIGVRRQDQRKPDYVDELYTADRLDDLLPRADVLAMSVPNTAETAGILDSRRLGLMKKSAYVINVGRGTAIDQNALLDALNSGRLKGAAIDVTVPEPLPSDSPLWEAKNLLITPHVSGLTGTNLIIADKVFDIFKYNLDAFLNDKSMKNLVDRQSGYRKLI